MQFEYDPDHLIAEVKKRPGIWDKDHIDNRSKSVRARLWPAIVKELIKANNTELTNSEARELELQLQKKWKGIRDCFQKYRMNPTKSRKPYVHYNQLQFLIKDNPSSDSLVGTKIIVDESSESEEVDSKPPKKRSKGRNLYLSRKKKIRLEREIEESDDNNDANEDYEFNTAPVEVETNTDSGHFAFADTSKSEADDSDKMFLLSLLPHLRSIPEEFRLNVKLELMQVLRVANESTAKLKLEN